MFSINFWTNPVTTCQDYAACNILLQQSNALSTVHCRYTTNIFFRHEITLITLKKRLFQYYVSSNRSNNNNNNKISKSNEQSSSVIHNRVQPTALIFPTCKARPETISAIGLTKSDTLIFSLFTHAHRKWLTLMDQRRTAVITMNKESQSTS